MKEVDGPNETFLSDSEMVERYVIALLYFSLNGQNWLQNDGFLSHLHVCNWFGVTCSNELVVKLEWSSNNLNGIYSSGIPKEISQHGNVYIIKDAYDLYYKKCNLQFFFC